MTCGDEWKMGTLRFLPAARNVRTARGASRLAGHPGVMMPEAERTAGAAGAVRNEKRRLRSPTIESASPWSRRRDGRPFAPLRRNASVLDSRQGALACGTGDPPGGEQKQRKSERQQVPTTASRRQPFFAGGDGCPRRGRWRRLIGILRDANNLHPAFPDGHFPSEQRQVEVPTLLLFHEGRFVLHMRMPILMPVRMRVGMPMGMRM